MFKFFINNLDTIASSPIALVGYIMALGAWTFTYFRSKRLKLISAVINSLPEADRKEVLLREYNIVPKRGLSAEQWLRSRRQFFLLISFISLLLVIVIIAVVTIVTKKNQDKMMKIVSPIGSIYPGISIEEANQIQNVLPLSCNYRATEYEQNIMYSNWNLKDYPLHPWNTLFGEQVTAFLIFCKNDTIFRISIRYMDNQQQVNRAFSNFQSTYNIEPEHHYPIYSIAKISNEKYRAVAVKSYATALNEYMTEITFEELNSPTFANKRW